MDCSHCMDQMDEYRRGGLSSSEMSAVAEHIAACSACSAELAAAEDLGRILREAGAAALPSDDYFAALTSTVLSRYGNLPEPADSDSSGKILQLEPEPAVEHARSHLRTLIQVAAVLVLAVGLGYVLIERDVLRSSDRNIARAPEAPAATDHYNYSVSEKHAAKGARDMKSVATSIEGYFVEKQPTLPELSASQVEKKEDASGVEEEAPALRAHRNAAARALQETVPPHALEKAGPSGAPESGRSILNAATIGDGEQPAAPPVETPVELARKAGQITAGDAWSLRDERVEITPAEAAERNEIVVGR